MSDYLQMNDSETSPFYTSYEDTNMLDMEDATIIQDTNYDKLDNELMEDLENAERVLGSIKTELIDIEYIMAGVLNYNLTLDDRVPRRDSLSQSLRNGMSTINSALEKLQLINIEEIITHLVLIARNNWVLEDEAHYFRERASVLEGYQVAKSILYESIKMVQVNESILEQYRAKVKKLRNKFPIRWDTVKFGDVSDVEEEAHVAVDSSDEEDEHECWEGCSCGECEDEEDESEEDEKDECATEECEDEQDENEGVQEDGCTCDWHMPV